MLEMFTQSQTTAGQLVNYEIMFSCSGPKGSVTVNLIDMGEGKSM